MPLKALCVALALSGLALATLKSAHAEGEADAKAVWDQFARDCKEIVAADDPARHASGLGQETSGAAATEDGRIAGATTVFVKAPGSTQNMTLQVMVNRFEGGRTVVCMLHLFQPDPALATLFEIAQGDASALSPDLKHAVGGPFQPSKVSGDAGSDAAIKDAKFARMSNDGFPPSEVLTVQVMPVLVGLTYFVSQAGRD